MATKKYRRKCPVCDRWVSVSKNDNIYKHYPDCLTMCEASRKSVAFAEELAALKNKPAS